MDRSTYEVRLANWKSIIEQCQAKPESQSTRQWLTEHEIPEKRYYYWLRRVRREAYEQVKPKLPTVQEPATPPAALVEIPPERFTAAIQEATPSPAIVIKTKKSTIEISSAVSDSLMLKLVKAVAHAL